MQFELSLYNGLVTTILLKSKYHREMCASGEKN